MGVCFFVIGFANLTGSPIDGAMIKTLDDWYKPVIFTVVRGLLPVLEIIFDFRSTGYCSDWLFFYNCGETASCPKEGHNLGLTLNKASKTTPEKLLRRCQFMADVEGQRLGPVR